MSEEGHRTMSAPKPATKKYVRPKIRRVLKRHAILFDEWMWERDPAMAAFFRIEALLHLYPPTGKTS